jgi:CubicO group peptidase (beta-lactamase class C family)
MTIRSAFRKLAHPFLACLVGVSGLNAQQLGFFPDSGRVERVKSTAAVVEQLYRNYWVREHLPGLSYGVVVDGRLIMTGSFGYANLEKKIPAGTTSLFRVASMSKSFTALAILRLRDEGKLRLDDPASDYIHELKGLSPLTNDSPPITIRNLLTHSAGFPEDDPWGDRQLADSDQELREFVRQGISLSNVPGILFEYSNLGFALLGQIVQVVSGVDFETYMKERIFEPLGMNSTAYEYSEVSEERLALGYGWIDSAWTPIRLEHHGAFGPMGGLITSIEDFAFTVALHLSAWPPRSGGEIGPLKRSSLREMQQPWTFSSLLPDFRYPGGRQCPLTMAYGYGLGWRRDCTGRVMVGHTGGLPGFGSDWRMMPEYGLAVMSFGNRTYGVTDEISMAVLDTILALTHLEPRCVQVSSLLERRKNQLVRLLPEWQGAESAGIFAENFFMDNRPEDLVKRTRELFARAGKIRNVGPMTAENQLRGSFLLEGEKGNIRIFFSLTPEKDPLIQQTVMRMSPD